MNVYQVSLAFLQMKPPLPHGIRVFIPLLPVFCVYFVYARAFPEKVLAKIEDMTSMDLKLYNAAVEIYREVGGDREELHKTETHRKISQ